MKKNPHKMSQNLRLEWLNPKTLAPNPHNWRKHPQQQLKIMDAVLTEVGWAGVALYNETTGRLIDGHARRDWAIAHNEIIMPVLVGSWSEADEKKLLATLDPIVTMAEQMDEIYRELLAATETDSESLKAWFDSVINEMDALSEHASLGNVPSTPKGAGKNLESCPRCGFEWDKSS